VFYQKLLYFKYIKIYIRVTNNLTVNFDIIINNITHMNEILSNNAKIMIKHISENEARRKDINSNVF